MMIVRRARLPDATAMAAVHVDSWRAAYLGLVPGGGAQSALVRTRAASWSRILAEGESRGSRAWVAVLDGRIAGFVSAGPTRDADDHRGQVGEVYAIYLARRRRGAAASKTLLRVAERPLRPRRCAAATIRSPSNARARRFSGSVATTPTAPQKEQVSPTNPLDHIDARCEIRVYFPAEAEVAASASNPVRTRNQVFSLRRRPGHRTSQGSPICHSAALVTLALVAAAFSVRARR